MHCEKKRCCKCNLDMFFSISLECLSLLSALMSLELFLFFTRVKLCFFNTERFGYYYINLSRSYKLNRLLVKYSEKRKQKKKKKKDRKENQLKQDCPSHHFFLIICFPMHMKCG